MSKGNVESANDKDSEHFDVLIVGAGISGVAAGVYLNKYCPNKNFLILEAEESYGGTWWTHRSPGIRSDSDLHTFGYSFKPWIGPPIATASEILSYMGEVIKENRLEKSIRYKHRILRANWCNAEKQWLIEAECLENKELKHFRVNFLWMCQGYYRHNEGYTPNWDGVADFKGRIAHPENWPDNLDYNDKKVVVIGSGATAATVVPAMASSAKHVTMLQRTPTFFRTGRNAIEIAETLRELNIDETWIHEITRRKIMHDQTTFTARCRSEPDKVRDELIGNIRDLLGPDYDVEKHFTPPYRPWRQRIAFVPDADLFKSIAEGRASVITSEIDKFVSEGIQLESGEILGADVIVTATGFNMNVMGDIDFAIDSEPLNFHDTVTYRGMMFTGVPNLAWVFGYFRGSWTIRSEIIAGFVCRLLNHMKKNGAKSVEPALRKTEQDMALFDWMDDEDFNPNYLKRALPLLPRRGDSFEWRHTQDHWREQTEFPLIDLDDEVFIYQGTDNSILAAE